MFSQRHIGSTPQEQNEMLNHLGYKNLDDFLNDVIPENIRRKNMPLPEALSEEEALQVLKQHAQKNQILRSFIGQGYYDTHTPSVIQRNILENPAWYTSYTPYQPEISQGRLEALLNFQTMISELCALPIANASLLDEATAAAEAMTLAKRGSKSKSNTFVIIDGLHPQTLAVLKTRAHYQNIELKTIKIGDEIPECFGLIAQYPDTEGKLIANIQNIAEKVHQQGAYLCLATDLLAQTILTPAGELGADIAIGSAQRFGVPLGFGGPHAGFIACIDALKRQIPGRIVGVSKDSKGKTAYRLALQTREQHIRREKATSNICTAQALLAIIAASYAVYHGAEGLKNIAQRVHQLTKRLAHTLKTNGYKIKHQHFFDTLVIESAKAEKIIENALALGFNLRQLSACEIGISLDECTNTQELEKLLEAFDIKSQLLENEENTIPEALLRQSAYLQHPTFKKYHSETEMMRYLRRLSDYDLALDRTMIPLGSCTMKLNAASEMMPISWKEFAKLHPFAPEAQSEGFRHVLKELENDLCQITGYDAVSLQPNSGAQGEYAGLLAIRAYHESKQEQRNICLIPSSAHGTNPASAALAGLDVVIVKCRENGDVDIDDLKEKIKQHQKNIACIMITYPSTHGVFEKEIQEICALMHEIDAQVYLDGANLNAQVGLAAPGLYGADVSHLNLHKTFAIPHGGGGPGVGPVAVKAHLSAFLPSATERTVSAAPYGSALVCLISWMYIRMMGEKGLRQASAIALLHANYIAECLKEAYPVLYTGNKGRVAHECILDIRPIKEQSGIQVDDIAKRLIDYGFHAPTMSFPVPGTLMIEPTESESKAELERFINAMLQIRKEIQDVENGKYPKDNNPLVHAPHTLADLTETWTRPYTSQEAIFPLPSMNPSKYLPPVNRIDQAYGDRHLFCSCPPIIVEEE